MKTGLSTILVWKSQLFNFFARKVSYVVDNPIRNIDPDGMDAVNADVGADGLTDDQWVKSSKPSIQNAGLANDFKKQNREDEAEERENKRLEGQGDNGETNDVTYTSFIYYSGTTISWYTDGQVTNTYNATSGVIGLQNSQYSNLEGGPVPGGLYSINLVPSPNRVAQYAPNTKLLQPNPEGGIETIPHYVTDSKGVVRDNYALWGSVRARLNPLAKTNTYGRDFFYLHNSEKGYTHGCIECESNLFRNLLQYRKTHRKILVIVKYPSTNTPTHGNTEN